MRVNGGLEQVARSQTVGASATLCGCGRNRNERICGWNPQCEALARDVARGSVVAGRVPALCQRGLQLQRCQLALGLVRKRGSNLERKLDKAYGERKRREEEKRRAHTLQTLISALSLAAFSPSRRDETQVGRIIFVSKRRTDI